MHSNFNKLANRRKSVRGEKWDPESNNFTAPSFPKTPEQSQFLIQACSKLGLLKDLTGTDLETVVKAMEILPVEKGQEVIQANAHVDHMYLIEVGVFSAFKNGEKIAEYTKEGMFGHLTLTHNYEVTVVADTKGVLWHLDCLTFKKVVLQHAFNKRENYFDLISKSPLLNKLDVESQVKIADALVTKQYAANEMIFKEGDEGTEMYFVIDGCVSIRKKEKNGTEMEVDSVKKGKFFGERALYMKEPRAASAIATETSKLAILEIDAFERLLGPCQEYIESKVSSYTASR